MARWPPPPRGALPLLALLLLVAATALGAEAARGRLLQTGGEAAPISVSCKQDANWTNSATNATVEQWQCNVNFTAPAPGPPQPGANWTDPSLCVELRCGGFLAGRRCTGAGADCTWNVRWFCRSPQPLWPGSTWNFGIITSLGAPVVGPGTTSAPVNGKCPGWMEGEMKP